MFHNVSPTKTGHTSCIIRRTACDYCSMFAGIVSGACLHRNTEVNDGVRCTCKEILLQSEAATVGDVCLWVTNAYAYVVIVDSLLLQNKNTFTRIQIYRSATTCALMFFFNLNEMFPLRLTYRVTKCSRVLTSGHVMSII